MRAAPGSFTFSFAIVIKGPLLRITPLFIDYYVQSTPSDVIIVYSHHNGTCGSSGTGSLAKLRELASRHTNRFAFTLNPEFKNMGGNHRNAQREAWYYGAKMASEQFGAHHVLLQRADAVFNDIGRLLPELRAIAQPPPAVPMPGGRVGFCALQIRLDDSYGRFHLDDHCMFGRAAAVVHFSSVDNVYYKRDARLSWSTAPGNVRRGCSFPSAESDAGYIWVMDDAKQRGLVVPTSTRDLLAERAFIIDPWAWGYVSRRGKGDDIPGAKASALPAGASASAGLPFQEPRIVDLLPPEMYNVTAPNGVVRHCARRSGIFDCSGVADDVANRTDSPRWGCSASSMRC